jgi:hypothetical protein
LHLRTLSARLIQHQVKRKPFRSISRLSSSINIALPNTNTTFLSINDPTLLMIVMLHQ